MDVGHDHVHARLHDAQGSGGKHRALVIEPAHEHVDAAPRPAEHVFGRHLAFVEHQLAGVGAAHAQLVQLLRRGEPLEPLLHDEGGDAPGAGVGVGLGVDHQGIGRGAVGDPHLGAVEHVAVALPVGAQAHGDHVGAGAGLAHGQGADALAADQPGQVGALLRRGAVAADLVDAEVGMGPVAEPHRGRGAADLLHRHHVLQIAHAGAAQVLLDGDAEQAQVPHLAPQIGGEFVVAVDPRGARGDFPAGEAAHGPAQHVGRLAKAEVQAGEVVGNHGRSTCWGNPARPSRRPQGRPSPPTARARGASGGVPARTTRRPGPAAADIILLYVYVNVN